MLSSTEKGAKIYYENCKIKSYFNFYSMLYPNGNTLTEINFNRNHPEY